MTSRSPDVTGTAGVGRPEGTSDGGVVEPGAPVVLDEAQASRRLVGILDRTPGRVILGITGAPGAGKSTYADALVAHRADAVVVGMDGFHLAHAALVSMGLADRKGAPDTFDVGGYVSLLGRLRRAGPETIWAPEFRRDLEDAIAGAVPVRSSTRLVVTEGNYLLLPGPWAEARRLCDEVWYVEVPEQARVDRLVRRHVEFGRSPGVARARATAGVDAENAALIVATRAGADAVVQLHLADAELAAVRP